MWNGLRASMGVALIACGGETAFQTLPPAPDPDPGEALMEVSHTEMMFASSSVGAAQSIPLLVTSTGETVLTINYGRIVQDDEGVFYTDEEANENIELAPGNAREFVIACVLREAQEATGLFRLDTNSRINPVRDIPMICTPDEADTASNNEI